MKFTYRAAPGASISQERAQQVGEFLETLGDAFTPADVVNAARSKSSPIHDQFEWNDGIAAERYRLVQARHLVNRITVVVKAGSEQTRAFHAITIQTSRETLEQRYTPVRVVSQDANMREQVIAKALRELESWRDRYEQYRDILNSNLFVEITRTIKRSQQRRSQSSETLR